MTTEDVLRSLSKVIDPDLKRNLVELNMVQNIRIEGSTVKFDLILTTPACPLKDYLVTACREQLKKDLGENIVVEVTVGSRVTKSRTQADTENLKNVKNIIAVISGKGGVGKSTIAVNLAVGLSLEGASVGLMDGDIYGPSIPIMMGLEGQKPLAREENGRQIIEPLMAYGVKVMSIGFFVSPDTSLIWRGPMASSYLQQLITSTNWGDLDYLIFDMPPGTGDLHLTLVQTVSVTGVVIVSTPQKVALADARKAVAMMQEAKIQVPVLGFVENMAYFQTSELPGRKFFIFGKEGTKSLAEQLNIPLLGQIPIDEHICAGGDTGIPSVMSNNTIVREAFVNFCRNTAQQLAIRNHQLPPTEKVQIK